MRKDLRQALQCLAFACIWIVASPSIRAADLASADIVATVGRISITRAELTKRLGDRLLRDRNDEYKLEAGALEEFADEILLSQAAADHKMTLPVLLQREVNQQVEAVTDAEAQAVAESSSAYRNLPPDQALRNARADIQSRRIAKRRAEYLGALRSKTPVVIHLEPPRLQHPIPGGQTIGPADASVSIVEFSDFQCPFCANLAGSLLRLRNEYPSDVRLTFKQFPLPIHPQAAKAAEAALCAAAQHRFWQMHDVLFGQQSAIAAERFSELAVRAKLDIPAFEKCLSSRQSLPEVNADHTQGMMLGITATPTVFLNGQIIVGAKPYDELRAMVDAEIKRAAGRR
jgi:predicted DsbA family dithiol-disulfide isomerase